ncbi:MAG: Gfo/Idh/MocA family protein [Heliomarina sp.]|uniref:Gfo/Idh/MocA family protein n=1 Tax=Heliomarina sp. TaxID=2917556 RepID=UPI0040586A51
MALNWGILGGSAFALAQMAPAIHSAKGARLTALATSSSEKASAFQAYFPDLRIHRSYEELLGDPDIDAVYIPLPNTLHVEWTMKALQAGKHVLSEKPVAMEAVEIDALIAMRDRTGLLATEAFMIVHHPQWQRARALIADGAIGKLVHVQGVFSYNNADQPGNIRNTPETGGGAIPDIGVYTYGSTRFATGEEITAITHADLDYENGVDTLARVEARFETFSASWVNSMRMYPAQMMSFVGDAGVIRLTAPFNAGVFGEAQVELHHGDKVVTVERFPGVNHYVLQVEAFCRSVAEDKPFAWSLEDAQATQSLIDAVYAKAVAD